MIYEIDDRKVVVEGECFVAESAHVVGSVTLKDKCSVWFNAVVRGDVDEIVIGEESNIQDGSVLHTDHGIKLNIGRGVTVGHMAMLHGCDVGDYSLIGINAVVLNRAKIGKYCVIGANALITEGKVIPDYSVVMGSPGKVVKTLDEAQVKVLEMSALGYVAKSQHYLKALRVDTRFDSIRVS